MSGSPPEWQPEWLKEPLVYDYPTPYWTGPAMKLTRQQAVWIGDALRTSAWRYRRGIPDPTTNDEEIARLLKAAAAALREGEPLQPAEPEEEEEE